MVFAKQNKTPISNMPPGLFRPETPPPPRPSNVIEINKSLWGGGGSSIEVSVLDKKLL